MSGLPQHGRGLSARPGDLAPDSRARLSLRGRESPQAPYAALGPRGALPLGPSVPPGPAQPRPRPRPGDSYCPGSAPGTSRPPSWASHSGASGGKRTRARPPEAPLPGREATSARPPRYFRPAPAAISGSAGLPRAVPAQGSEGNRGTGGSLLRGTAEGAGPLQPEKLRRLKGTPFISI